MTEYKPILLLDFDGVIHSYDSGWGGAESIPDPPVPGALGFIDDATSAGFDVQIYSSRSRQNGGIAAMKKWFEKHGRADLNTFLKFPTQKPAAFLTIDDRAFCFEGTFPDPVGLLDFKPWNKR